ncbi:MAG: protein-ADP-ribose hydrolase, partial [Coriobacteriales bacterium]|nr:protein-ADP-ribose hydrolase [Coriobacteriales bacterium]
MDQTRKHYLLEQLVADLCAERGIETLDHASSDELWSAFRALVNTRAPEPASHTWLEMQDELLQGMISEKGIASVDDTTPSPANPQLRLWRGDITTLAAAAIVNAANSQMLGCWVPGHHCIDNAIHT